MWCCRSLPSRQQVMQRGLKSATNGVALERDIPYGPGSRAVLDVYLPAWACTPHNQAGPLEGLPPHLTLPLPVVFFVHGGVWASGEKW